VRTDRHNSVRKLGRETDIERAARVLSRLSADELPTAIRKAGITQAAIDEIASIVRAKARIARLDVSSVIDNFVHRYGSQYTQQTYRHNIAHWLSWCRQEGIHPLEATGDHADAYAGSLQATKLSPATVNIRINAVSSFYSHLVKRRHVSSSPFTAVRRARQTYETQTVATAEQLREAVGEEPEAVRLAVRVMLATGVRVGALATFSTSSQGAWGAASKGSIHAGTLTDKELIKAVRALGEEERITYWVNTNRLKVRIKRACVKAGITGGAHQCRHRFALNLYQSSGKARPRAPGHRYHNSVPARLTGTISIITQ